MSNDYRNNDKNRTGWYYAEGKRYVPRSMMEEDERRNAARRRREPRGVRYRGEERRRPSERGGANSGQTRSMRVAKTVFATSLSLLLFIVAAVAVVYIYVQNNILNRITFVDDTQVVVEENLDNVVISDDGDTGQGEEMTEGDAEALLAMINGGLVAEENLYREDGVTNILLLGTDNRGFSLKGSRSDAMILLSINENTRQIIMTSVMRDVCVSIPGRSGVDKINAAHAYGGAPLAVQTVETNFGVDIDRYISVNFYAFIDVVDALGGLRLAINEQERVVMNDYISEINRQLGLGVDHGKLYETGNDLPLTGKQVLGYVRNRYTGNGDFARTERQRIVLDKIIEQCKQADVLTLLNVVEAAASYMSTNFEQGELVSFATNAVDYLDYDVITSRLPMDDTWEYARLNGMSIINIDIGANRKELIRMVYGK